MEDPAKAIGSPPPLNATGSATAQASYSMLRDMQVMRK
jgi:hypothetical protein